MFTLEERHEALVERVDALERKLEERDDRPRPPHVCTGSGTCPIEQTNWYYPSEGTCGICGQKVRTNVSTLVIHPYVDLKVS